MVSKLLEAVWRWEFVLHLAALKRQELRITNYAVDYVAALISYFTSSPRIDSYVNAPSRIRCYRVALLYEHHSTSV
jgi:hypothetical protein